MLRDGDKRWLRRRLGGSVRFDEPMAGHTSFRIGGPADAWVEPESESQLKVILQWARRQNIPYLTIGGGTNLLVRDGGIRGMVIHIGRMASEVSWVRRGEAVAVSAGAGVATKRICALALRHGWQGMNFALGIPGTVGGAVLMNAGTAHGSMAGIIESVTVMTASGEKEKLQRRALNEDYRRLQLPDTPSGTAVLTAVGLALAPGDRKRIRDQARQWMRGRSKNQPAWQPSAGCFFKNPSKDQPAGRLIDQAGLKGWRFGGAQVSSRHANFIINRGDASAQDVLAVAAKVRKAVKFQFNIDLVPEVRIVGQEKTGA